MGFLSQMEHAGLGNRQTKENPNSDIHKPYAVHIFPTYPSGKTLVYSFYSPWKQPEKTSTQRFSKRTILRSKNRRRCTWQFSFIRNPGKGERIQLPSETLSYLHTGFSPITYPTGANVTPNFGGVHVPTVIKVKHPAQKLT